MASSPPARRVLKGVYGDPALHLDLATSQDEWDSLTPCELVANATRWLQREKSQMVEDCVAPERRVGARTTVLSSSTTSTLTTATTRGPSPGQLLRSRSRTRGAQAASCPANCHGHGTCIDGKYCLCNPPYEGATCNFCKRPDLPQCGKRCEIAFCTRRITEAKCTPAAVRKLVRFRCTAPRRLEALALVDLALGSSRPVLIGRAGNVELKMIAAAGSLLHEGRVSNLHELVGPSRKSKGRHTERLAASEYTERQTFVFGRIEYMTAIARNSSRVPSALHRFLLEYTRALASADVEMAWDEQCEATFLMRCQLEQLARSAPLARYSLPLVRALGALPPTFSRMVHYNTSVSYWLDVLEELSRRKARLLVVTGFAESVRYQIPQLQRVHPSRDLSGLRIRVLAAPLVFPGFGHSPTPGFPRPERQEDEHYAHYLDEMRASREWDPALNEVALLGCGFFGMPLARRATQANISAIYVGGLIQLLFGITGRRYLDARGLIKKLHKNNRSSHARGMDGSKETAVAAGSRLATDTLSGSLVNEHWIPPLASETPSEYKTYEKGAYWR